MSEARTSTVMDRLMDFIESRTGIPMRVRPERWVVGGARLSLSLGPVIAWLLVLEFVTGCAMATIYAPSSQTAWASVFFLQHRTHWGGFVRGLHHWASDALLVVTLLHLVQILLAGAYRKPREVNWWLGLLLMGLVLGGAHTGALLPWDQAAYWTTQVEATIASTMPGIGPIAQRMIQGGREIGSLTVSRLYAIHVGLLPVLTLVAVWGHVVLAKRHGSVPALSVPDDVTDADGARVANVRVSPYAPDQVVRNRLLAVLVIGVVAACAARLHVPFDAPADPNSEYPARPEWWLLGLFKLRKLFTGQAELIATVVIPGVMTGFFVTLPFLDRALHRRLTARLLVVVPALAILGATVGYTAYAARHDAHDAAYLTARHTADVRAARAFQLAMAGIPPEGPLEMVRNDPTVRPGEIFAERCGSCHAPTGNPSHDAHGQRTAVRGPALEGFGSRQWATNLVNDPSAEELFHRTNIDDMPSQARRLGGDVAAIAEYLYAQSVEGSDTPANAALAAHGEDVYRHRCTSCHQGAGDLTETDAADRDAPDLTGWGSRAWIREQIVNPSAPTRYGSRNEMPGFSEELQGRELEWTVDYVRALRARTIAPLSAPPPPPDSASR